MTIDKTIAIARRGGARLATVAVLLGLSACGVGEPEQKEALSDDARAACIAQATELRDAERDEPSVAVPGPFDMSKSAGKSLWIINAARVPFLQRISDGAEAAAEAAGMDVKVVYGDGSTNAAQTAVQQAVAQGADGIALVVVDPTTIQNAVDKANEAGIVVTDVINRSVGDPMPSGVTGQLVINLPEEMDAMAGWILADSNCAANTLMYAPSALPITAAAAKLIQKTYMELCSTCTFEVKDLDYGNYASTLTAEVQTDVRRIPDLTHIFAIIGSSVPNVDSGLRGRDDIAVLAHDGLEDNLSAMRSGDTHLVADIAFAISESIGWQIVDQQGRLFQGRDDAAEVVIPSRLVDETNVGGSEDDIFPAFNNFEATYTAAWAG